MNICFIKGKIITKLENKSKIKVIGYNEIADKCYKELEKEDIIWIEGGISEYTNKMNIYDFAGNEWEWTLEQTSDSDCPCANRGGGYDYSGSYKPASNRSGNGTTRAFYDIGFHPALYVN